MDNVTQIRPGRPSLDSSNSDDQTGQPCNLEAEQALLGAILSNNDVFDPVSEIINSSHFFDPVHQDLFQLITERITRRSFASPVTLKSFVDNIPGLADLGGIDYLFRLANAAISIHLSKDFAQEIFDLSRRRQLMALGRELIDLSCKMDATKPVGDLIQDIEVQLFQLNEIGQRGTGFQSFVRATTDAVKLAHTAKSRTSRLAGLATGFVDLDRLMGGLHRSDLIIVAGRPSIGKTALATNIAFNVAKNYNRYGVAGDKDSIDGGHVGFFSLEMSAVQLAGRILAERSRIPAYKIRRGEINNHDFPKYVKAAKDLQAVPLFIDDTPALTIAQLATRARRLKEMQDLHLLVVDYLQLVRPTNSRENRVNAVSEVSQGLKAIAKELNIPVIAVAQLSRSVEGREDKRPQLSDLRESGSIEQDADVVMFVYREAYYQRRKEPAKTKHADHHKWQHKMDQIDRVAEVIIGKQRHGPIGSVELDFDETYTVFGNRAQPHRSEGAVTAW